MTRLNELTVPGATTSGLLGLILDLAVVGVTVEDADHYEQLALLHRVAEPAPPLRLLDLDADTARAYLRQAALDRLAEADHRDHAGAYIRQLNAEMAASIRRQADRIIAELNARFKPQLEAAVKLRSLGVTEHDTPASLLSKPQKVIAAFNRFDDAARDLDQLVELRIDLSRVAGVPPTPRSGCRPNWGRVLDPSGETVLDRAGENRIVRWLRLAANPELTLQPATNPKEA